MENKGLDDALQSVEDILVGKKEEIEMIKEPAQQVNNEEKPRQIQRVSYTYESQYPKKLQNVSLERTYIGLLLDNPKNISKYYVVFDDCYFDDPQMENIYKSVLFTEGSDFSPEVAKARFNFAKITDAVQKLKFELRYDVQEKNYSMEKTFVEIMKLFVLRKNFLASPIKEKQEKIAEITEYELYDKMSIEEVEGALLQIIATEKFKHSVLSSDLTGFLEENSNNLTSGLAMPFKILTEVFKGIRKGETMAYAMPSNSGKSRFTINLAAYISLVHKQKVLVISNEMSEDKMKLCLITTIINNPAFQQLHGQKIHKTEGELLEFKFRPDDILKNKVDENGFVVKGEDETQEEFVKRLKEISTEFNKVIAATDWVNKEISNYIYFVNITDHTNEELKKIIMNYYYKEKIQYMFYDTLKADTENIGNGEEIKKTATILSNMAQAFEIFIASSIQLSESSTLPINLTINDITASRTVKEVLDTLCLIKQIHREDLADYEYSLKEVDTKFYDLENVEDPDVRYYACVVDKNRAGAKPKTVFRLNLAYNSWEELGYLRLKSRKYNTEED